MRKRATQTLTLKELYEVTERIPEPEITPVLKGNYRIQGPVDESDHALQKTNLGKRPGGKKFKLVKESLPMRVDTGTCNMCSAPCSSCLHSGSTMSVRELKMDCGASGNPCVGREADGYFFLDYDGMPLYRSRIWDDSQHAGSVASNVFSASSSHDSYAEIAESKVMLSPSRKCETAEDVELPSVVPLSDTIEGRLPENREAKEDRFFCVNKTFSMFHRTSASQDEEQRGLVCNRDNTSCITGTGDPNTGVGHGSVKLEKKIASSSSASTDTLLAKEREYSAHSGAADVFHCNRSKENWNNCKKQIICSNKLKNADFAGTMLSDKYNPDVHIVNDSLEIQSPCFRSESEYVACHLADFKDTEGSTSSQFCIDRESLLGSEPIGSTSIIKNTPSSNDGNCRANLIRNEFSLDAVESTDQCLKNGISSIETTKSTCTKEKIAVSNSLPETSELQHQQEMGSGNFESDEFTDVKICDICGDAGREYLLAVCSKCSDGAEHTYCMREMLHKVPDGNWLCEECQFVEDAERKKVERECNLKEDTKRKVDKSDKVFGTVIECKLKENVKVKVEKSGKVSQTAKVCKPEDDTLVKKVDRFENVHVASKDCRSKEDIKCKQVNKTAMASASPKLSIRKATLNFATTSNSKFIPKLDMKAIDADVRRVPQVLQSPRTSAKRLAENEEVKLVNSKRPRGISGDPILGSPRKRIALSSETLLKNKDMGKARVITKLPPTDVQHANNCQTLSHSQSTLGSHPPKVQDQLQPPSGFLQRSTSFNNLNSKPKVKQLAESVPVKFRMVRESTVSGTRKEATTRLMTKSSSFKSVSSVRPVSKAQFVHQSRAENARYLKHVKERNVPGMKISSTLNHPTINLSPRTGSAFPLSKVDTKAALHDSKLNDLSKPNGSKTNKGSDDANGLGRTDTKKLLTNAPKIPGSASMNLKSNDEDQRSCQSPKKGTGISGSTMKSQNNTQIGQRAVLHNAGPTYRDDKNKESSILSSVQIDLGGYRILRCQKCYETGHTTQSCAVDKLCSSALKPSAKRNLTVVNKKSSKWKAVKGTIIKSRIQKNEKQNDLLQESAASSPKPSCGIASKDMLCNSPNHCGDIPPVVGTSDGQEYLRDTYVDSMIAAQVADHGLHQLPEDSSTCRAAQATEASSTLRGSDFSKANAASDELNMKSVFHILPDEPSVLAHPVRTAATPELKFIWQGSLEVLSSGTGPTFFDGIQAHLSTSASSKVLDAANKLPCRVQLEEVPCSISWPLQSHGNCPNEYNISLFFFAKDVESYKTSYGKLLEKMLKNDLALEGIINDIELHIFPSNKLPVDCQSWNGLFFLWGIFKERRKVANTDNESPSYARPETEKALKPTVFLKTLATSCSKIEDKMYKRQESLIHNFLCHSTADSMVPLEQNSYSFPVSQSLSGSNQISDVADTHPELKFEMADIKSCSKVKSGEPSMKNLGQESGGRYGVASSSAHVPATNQQIGRRASPSYSIFSDHLGTDCTRSRNELGNKQLVTTNEAVIYDEPEEIFKARSSSKVHPLGTSVFLNEQQQHRESRDCANIESLLPDARGNAERFYFPIALPSTKPDNTVHILSSDDEDAPQFDLELALGCKRKARERPIKKIAEDNNNNNDDDILVSLSLSLEIPTPREESRAKPVLKPEQHLQDDVDTSLHLFSGFTGS